MEDLDDKALLREYVRLDSGEARPEFFVRPSSGLARRSEVAFAMLVARHVNKVYSVALRHTGNAHYAEEVTQAVFVILARKASQLGKDVVLEGWLYQTARLTAITFVRSEIRRARREQEAQMETLDQNESEVWTQIAPLLDTAMDGLNKTDRYAVVLRFFYGKSMKEIGVVLGGSEGAVRLRLHRAMEKLRLFFLKRGIASTTATLAGAISVNAVQIAPPLLAKTAASIALANQGAAMSSSTLTLAKGALKVMAWTKAKTAIVVGATMLMAAGTTATLVVQHQLHSRTAANIPRSSWKNAGYGSPASTIQTVAWAVVQDDSQTMFASLSPDCQQEFREVVKQIHPATPAEQFLLQIWKQQLIGRSGIRILKTEEVSAGQVLLDLSLQGGSKSDDHWLKVQKFSDEWKVDDFDPKGRNGRTGMNRSPN